MSENLTFVVDKGQRKPEQIAREPLHALVLRLRGIFLKTGGLAVHRS